MQISGVDETAGGGQQYRLYFFDGVAHVAAAPYEFEAPEDEAAVRIAESWREGRRMELWNKGRKVRCWGFSRCANPHCE